MKLDLTKLVLKLILLNLFSIGAAPEALNFNKVYMKTHRRSGLLISKFAL